jgi:hypothetical protein
MHELRFGMQCKVQGTPLYRFVGQVAAGNLTYGVPRLRGRKWHF